MKLTCTLLGHRAANVKRCRCCDVDLSNHRSYTRIRHVLSCFLFHHSYVRLDERDRHHEYVCLHCGHPLLIPSDDPFAARESFLKRPRYWCSLFGHHVHVVGERAGFTEYACACGHSFLKSREGMEKITHPWICTIAGHSVCFLTARNGYLEYLCRHCGHAFCLPKKAA